MVELVVRLVFSLAVVLGLMIMLARFSAKRFRGGSGSLIRVVHRQALSRSSSIAVVTVGSRVLVVGTTEQQVQLLTELEPEEIEGMLPDLDEGTDPNLAADGVASVSVSVSAPVLTPARSHQPGTSSDSVLAGSVLSAQTWRQAFAAATKKDRAAS